MPKKAAKKPKQDDALAEDPRNKSPDSLPTPTARPPHVLLINGPNLNLLGTREPAHYGADTLADIEARLGERAAHFGVTLSCFQSNAEADIVGRIQGAPAENVDFVIINPAAFTHTSVAIRDAFSAVGMPFIEVHLSNVHKREPFRHHSYLSDIAEGVIIGLGPLGYELALGAAATRLLRAAAA